MAPSPTPSQCVESWLTASNLAYAIPNFRMAGIVSPRSFVELELAYFEPLGIKRPEDRKKLFFLIQKVKSELDKVDAGDSGSSEESYVCNISPMKVQTSTGRDNVRLAGYNANNKLSLASTANNNEVGMSVDTDSSNMDPISPVTLGSPLTNEYDIATGKTNEAIKTATSLLDPKVGQGKMTSRERLEKELEKRRTMKQEEIARFTTSTNSQTSNYTDDFDDLDDASSTVGSKKRRSSMLPRISKKDVTTPLTISAGRKSLHSRPTIKKANQSESAIAVGRRKDEDDESISSETSDLSSSIQSYSSLGSSSLTKTKSSRASTGTYSSHTNENRQRGIETKLTSRLGKRLSTIPSTGVAPISPLAPLPALSSNLDNGLSTKQHVKKTSVAKRSSMGRPGTADSMSSYKTTATIKSMSSTASAKSKTNLNRPSSRASIGSISSRNKIPAPSTSTTRKAPPKSPGRAIRPQLKSPTASSRGPTRDRSVSPANSPYSARAASPFRSVQGRALSPTRNIKTAASQGRSISPTRSIKTAGSQKSHGISPTRRVQTAISRERSVTPSRVKAAAHSPTGRRSPPPNVKSPTNSAAVFVHGQAEDKSWGTQIAQLRENFDEEHVQIMEGQEAYQEDEDYEMRIRVIVRKRPMSKREALEMGDVDVIHPLDYTDHGRILVYQPKTKLDLAKEVETTSFAFDNVFGEESNNLEIYGRAVRNLIPGVFRGKWASVFAYGQTGSGKTFTMMGCNMTGLKAGNQQDNHSEANLGLYFLAARDVFRIAQEQEYQNISISVSLFEIYGGKLIDLLNGRGLVKCLEDSKGKVCFPGLTEHPVHDAEELMNIIEQGSLNRSTGTTSANADSSRSHAVLQLSLRKDVGRVKAKEHGRLTFIDLAGSERGADTNQASKTTRMEGAEINTSLLALKEVIRALATGSSMKRIPFRGSKLTQVLKDSFVGANTRTVMCVNVAPNMKNCDHTLNTLRYADRVKERDPQTGALSAAVEANSRIKRDQNDIARVKVPPRPLTAPATSFRIDHTEDSSDDDEIPPPPSNRDHLFPEERSYFDDDFNREQEVAINDNTDAFDDCKSVDSDDLDSLEEALRSENDVNPKDLPTPAKSINEEKAAASRSLISTHRSILSSLLSIVKHEMALVNDDYVDGEGDINDYLEQIGNLTNNQLSLLSTLQESLNKFNALKTAKDRSQTNDSYGSDESFDLGD